MIDFCGSAATDSAFSSQYTIFSMAGEYMPPTFHTRSMTLPFSFTSFELRPYDMGRGSWLAAIL